MNRVMHQNLWGGDFHFCPLRMTYHRNCFPVANNYWSWYNCFQTGNLGCEPRKSKCGELSDCPAYCLFSCCCIGAGNLTSTVITFKRTRSKFRQRQLEFTGKSTKAEEVSERERSRDCRGFPGVFDETDLPTAAYTLSCFWLFCDPMDCSLPGFSVHGISLARILEWVAVSFSRGPSWPGIKPASPALTGEFFTTEPPGKPNT